MDNTEQRIENLNSKIRAFSGEIAELEDILSQRKLRQRLYGLRSQRDKLLAELGELQEQRERAVQTHA